MRLGLFDIDGRKYYATYVWEIGGKCLYHDFYSTKKEAIKATKEYKKKYKGNKKLECFIRYHDEYGFGIKDYDI